MNATMEMLGLEADARALLVNMDDLGMYAGVNEAIFASFDTGLGASASLMVPWPGAGPAVERLAERTQWPFGIHLCLVSDIDGYRQGPVSDPGAVPSLVDGEGLFLTEDRIGAIIERVRIGEVEREFRAQIESVLDLGLAPTHLDWHCLHNGGRAEIFDLTLELALEYGLAMRAWGAEACAKLRARGLPASESGFIDSFSLPVADRAEAYAHLLRDLPPGLTDWAVHPGLDDAASRALDPGGWPVRAGDFAFVTSPEARAIVEAEGIVAVGFGDLQRAWTQAAA